MEMEVGKRWVVDDPDGAFSVPAYDANHCAGNLESSKLENGHTVYQILSLSIETSDKRIICINES